MKEPAVIFKSHCRERGMRYTPEREMIINEIYRKDGHFDIDELFMRIRSRHPKIKLAKGSIYRTLPFLIDAGLVRRSLSDARHACYEHTLGHSHHDHLKCVGCGRIFEFSEDRIDKAQKEVCDKFKFKMLWHVHVVSGYCMRCAQEKGKAG
ncbi:Fur family transcriptional regulator [Candidatus Omnitrophota bacterium]